MRRQAAGLPLSAVRLILPVAAAWAAAAWVVAAGAHGVAAAASSPFAASTLEVGLDGGVVDLGEVSPIGSPYVVRDALQLAVSTWGLEQWTLCVQAEGDFSAGEGGPTFPADSLEVAARLGGEPAQFQTCSTSPVPLVVDGPTSGGIVVVDYRLNVGYDAPYAGPDARYRVDLVYTVSAGIVVASFAAPNPFDPDVHGVVSIRYYCPPGMPRNLTFSVYDADGIKVRSMTAPTPAEGWAELTWDGRADGGGIVPDGTYTYRIAALGRLVAGGYILVDAGSRQRGSAARESEAVRRETPLEVLLAVEPAEAAPGDIVACRASVRNLGLCALEDARLECEFAGGIRSLGTAAGTVDGRPVNGTADADGTHVSWRLGRLEPGRATAVSFSAVVGPDPPVGAATVRARATAGEGGAATSSADATAVIRIWRSSAVPCGAISGCVFLDDDADGRRDETERGAPGVVVVADGGSGARTDGAGGFVLTGLEAGDHVLTIAAGSAPAGYSARPRGTTLAAGEVARVLLPLEPAAAGSQVGSHPASASASAVVTLGASSGGARLDGQGDASATLACGAGLTVSAGIGGSLALSSGSRTDPAAATPADVSAVARLGFTADISPRLALSGGIARDILGGQGGSRAHLRLDATLSNGLALAAGCAGDFDSLWASGGYEWRLGGGLALSTGVRVSGESAGGDPGRALRVRPRLGLAYSGASGLSGTASIWGPDEWGGDLACSARLTPGVTASVVHRWTASDRPDTSIGLALNHPDGISARIDWRPGAARGGGSLGVAAQFSADAGFLAGIEATFERDAATLSLSSVLRRGGPADPVVWVCADFEDRGIADGTRAATLSAVLAGSRLVGPSLAASASWSVKHVQWTSEVASVCATTSSVAAYLDWRSSALASVGAGIVWTHQAPGGASVVAGDLRASYDLAPWARIIVGYRCAPHAVGSAPPDPSAATGPYVRLVLTPSGQAALGGTPLAPPSLLSPL